MDQAHRLDRELSAATFVDDGLKRGANILRFTCLAGRGKVAVPRQSAARACDVDRVAIA